jgi:phosphoglycerate kinase
MNYPKLQDLTDISGKRVLVRLDFNVPVQDGKVVDDYRIKKSLPTLQYLQEQKAKIIIISHIEGGTDSLKPVFDYLVETMKLPVTFCQDCLEEGDKYTASLAPGEMLLCENLRLYDGEKRNDSDFAEKLSKLGDVFVNDAFSVSHRKHASVVGMTKFLKGYLGLQFQEEINGLSSCFSPKHPFLFVLGGAKFDTKLPLVEKFGELADTLFVGGALSNDLYKLKGWGVGKSLVADTAIDFSKIKDNSRVMIPVDVVVDGGTGVRNAAENDVHDDEIIVDAGTETLKQLQEKIGQAEQILWNGPLGNYEKGFKQPTLELARMIAEATKRGATTILGGGDTLAAIAELGLDSSFTFVSTGGGAMLDYLAFETLPGLDALKK